MAISQELQEKINYYEQAYFYTDEPVPFLDNIKVYPVMAKDYYKFYSSLSCLTMDKTTKKTKIINEKGQPEEKTISNPQGIGMSYMAYLIEQMENADFGQYITAQVISILELCLHIKNGLFCPDCGKQISSEEIAAKFTEFEQSIANSEEYKNMSDLDKKAQKIKFLQDLNICECGGQMREVYSIKSGTIKKLCIYNNEISPSKFDELIAIITHQNILDYDGDKYIDPNLKADLELKSRLENKNYSSPSLEKQLIAVSISSSYTIDELKETVTLRKLAYMLKIIDAKNYYYAQIQGAMSGMVKFKTDPVHWLFGENKKDISKEIMTLNDVQSKFAAVT